MIRPSSSLRYKRGFDRRSKEVSKFWHVVALVSLSQSRFSDFAPPALPMSGLADWVAENEAIAHHRWNQASNRMARSLWTGSIEDAKADLQDQKDLIIVVPWSKIQYRIGPYEEKNLLSKHLLQDVSKGHHRFSCWLIALEICMMSSLVNSAKRPFSRVRQFWLSLSCCL